ncbi:MAG: hypothetical protein GWN84_20870 [Gammaproteobacteria bacterium]|nr:hypothetical protein [Gammaproteobacteria bacterium]NIR85214.1 hypothetical protein [Gammaproteobacteria bacterium]NIU06264.1 hypothetical protein [Gammaproteobacteria bacterium]NIX87537.1 hypothetical protein [Gammaproteobacteria bacterium]
MVEADPTQKPGLHLRKPRNKHEKRLVQEFLNASDRSRRLVRELALANRRAKTALERLQEAGMVESVVPQQSERPSPLVVPPNAGKIVVPGGRS